MQWNYWKSCCLTITILAMMVFPRNVVASDGNVLALADDIAMPQRGICAHRGANITHPENTLAAFREAVRLGAHQIEFDVRMTKDGHCVIMHDPTVDRTTDGQGKVVDMTLKEIKRLDAGVKHHPMFTGERVPTLEEALAMMPINIWVNLHLKSDGTGELGAKVARETVRQGRVHQAFLATDHAAAEAARKVCPDILICNMERQARSSDYVSDTIAHHDQFVQLLGKMVSSEDMAKLKAASVRVNYYFCDKPEELPRLFQAGVDFSLTNRVDVKKMLEAAQRLGVAPVKPVYRKLSR